MRKTDIIFNQISPVRQLKRNCVCQRPVAEFKMRIVTKKRSVVRRKKDICEVCGGIVKTTMQASQSVTSVKQQPDFEPLTFNIEEQPPKPFSVFDMLSKSVNLISRTIIVQEFIIKNRLVKIQRFYKSRFSRKLKAKQIIVKQFRQSVFKQRSYSKQIKAAKRLIRMFHDLKVKKVFASMVLNQTSFRQQYSEQTIRAVVVLQRYWRIKYQRKFRLYRQLMKS